MVIVNFMDLIGLALVGLILGGCLIYYIFETIKEKIKNRRKKCQ